MPGRDPGRWGGGGGGEGRHLLNHYLLNYAAVGERENGFCIDSNNHVAVMSGEFVCEKTAQVGKRRHVREGGGGGGGEL